MTNQRVLGHDRSRRSHAWTPAITHLRNRGEIVGDSPPGLVMLLGLLSLKRHEDVLTARPGTELGRTVLSRRRKAQPASILPQLVNPQVEIAFPVALGLC